MASLGELCFRGRTGRPYAALASRDVKVRSITNHFTVGSTPADACGSAARTGDEGRAAGLLCLFAGGSAVFRAARDFTDIDLCQARPFEGASQLCDRTMESEPSDV
jgi:hypothetical protein